MPSPVLVASTDPARQVLFITVEGPLAETASTDALRSALPAIPAGYSVIVDVTNASEITPDAAEGLRDVARDAIVSGQTVVFVCGDLDHRTRLVLADLDTLAPVVPAVEDALPLFRSAA